MRNLAEVIDQLLTVIPNDHAARPALLSVKSSAEFAAPEMLLTWWNKTADILFEHFPLGTPEYYKLASIFGQELNILQPKTKPLLIWHLTTQRGVNPTPCYFLGVGDGLAAGMEHALDHYGRKFIGKWSPPDTDPCKDGHYGRKNWALEIKGQTENDRNYYYLSPREVHGTLECTNPGVCTCECGKRFLTETNSGK